MQVGKICWNDSLKFGISDPSFVLLLARYATTIYYPSTCEITGGPYWFGRLLMFGFEVLLDILMGIKLVKC